MKKFSFTSNDILTSATLQSGKESKFASSQTLMEEIKENE